MTTCRDWRTRPQRWKEPVLEWGREAGASQIQQGNGLDHQLAGYQNDCDQDAMSKSWAAVKIGKEKKNRRRGSKLRGSSSSPEEKLGQIWYAVLVQHGLVWTYWATKRELGTESLAPLSRSRVWEGKSRYPGPQGLLPFHGWRLLYYV